MMIKSLAIALGASLVASAASAQQRRADSPATLGAPAPNARTVVGDDARIRPSASLDEARSAMPHVVPRDGDPEVEALLGAAGYAVGGGLGLALYTNGGEEARLVTAPSAILLAGLGIASGVTLGGEATGGDGTFLAAFVGQAIGGFASLFVTLAADNVLLALPVVVVLPVAGGVLGYHVSDYARRED